MNPDVILRYLAPSQRILLGLCGFLIAILIYESATPIGDVSVPTVSLSPRAAMPSFFPRTGPPSSASLDLDTHPLFSPTRKPVIAPADQAKAGAARPFPTDLVLVGVIIDAGHHLAILRQGTAPLSTTISVGNEIEGWQISQIEADHIALSAGAITQNLMLRSNKSASPTGQESVQGVAPAQIPAPSPQTVTTPGAAAQTSTPNGATSKTDPGSQ